MDHPVPEGFEAEPFRVLVENLPGIVYRCRNDEHWTMVFISPYVEALTGLPASDYLEGKAFYSDRIHPEDRKRVWNEVQRALQKREPFRLQYRLLDRSGAVRWVQEDGRGVYGPDGVLTWLDGVILDHTEQALAMQSLRTHEEHLRMALRAARMGVWRWEQGQVLERTEKVDQLFGFPSASPGLRMRDFMARIADEDKARIPPLLKTQEVIDLVVGVQPPHAPKSKVRVLARLFKDSHGKVLMAMGTLQPHTEDTAT
jgi:PAS domain S-box-containing protein